MDNLIERTGHVLRFKKMADGRAIDMKMIVEHLAAYESLGGIEYLRSLVRTDMMASRFMEGEKGNVELFAGAHAYAPPPVGTPEINGEWAGGQDAEGTVFEEAVPLGEEG